MVSPFQGEEPGHVTRLSPEELVTVRGNGPYGGLTHRARFPTLPPTMAGDATQGEHPAWHAAAVPDAARRLGTDSERGLDEAEARQRLARFGPNDPSLFRYRYPGNFVGQTIHVKLPAFNLFGQALQDLAGLTADTYTLTGAGAVASVTVPIQFLGVPQALQPIVRHTFGQSVSLPAALAGSTCSAGVAASAAQVFDIAKNGANFATMSFAAGMSAATFAGPAQSFIAGDVLTIAPRATDATLADISGYLAGTS